MRCHHPLVCWRLARAFCRTEHFLLLKSPKMLTGNSCLVSSLHRDGEPGPCRTGPDRVVVAMAPHLNIHSLTKAMGGGGLSRLVAVSVACCVDLLAARDCDIFTRVEIHDVARGCVWGCRGVLSFQPLWDFIGVAESFAEANRVASLVVASVERSGRCLSGTKPPPSNTKRKTAS